MILGHIGSHDEDAITVLQILLKRGGTAATE
jgi:hypothetical protein